MMCAKREGDLGFRDFKVFTRAMVAKLKEKSDPGTQRNLKFLL